MINFPIFIKLHEQNCLVVGGGVVATRKIKQLLIAGAKVFVVAPTIEPVLKEFNESGEIYYSQQAYTEECLEGKQLVIAPNISLLLKIIISPERVWSWPRSIRCAKCAGFFCDFGYPKHAKTRIPAGNPQNINTC